MSTTQETTVWSGTPSQKSNLGLYSLCGLVAIVLIASAIRLDDALRMPLLASLLLPVAVSGWRWLVTRSTLYTLTDQRLMARRGVFGRVTDDLELYRVKDSHFTQPFLQRMLGIGTITLRTTDASTPIVTLPGMADPDTLWQRIRALVETRRDAKGVREIDMNSEREAS
jgi:uncharacterized membrane protein YdbT with pleckstrin-like domain